MNARGDFRQILKTHLHTSPIVVRYIEFTCETVVRELTKRNNVGCLSLLCISY